MVVDKQLQDVKRFQHTVVARLAKVSVMKSIYDIFVDKINSNGY